MKLKNFIHGACVAMAAWAGNASAQIAAHTPVVPESKLVSPDGVDMRTGEYVQESIDLSIGPAAAGGFTLVRVPQKFKPFTTNWHYVVRKTPNSSGGNYYQIENQAIARTFFSIGGGPFTEAGMVPADGLSTLQRLGSGAGAYFLFTAADGTTTRFQASSKDNGTWAEEIRRPTGLTYSFAYDAGGPSGATRLRRVSSNAGYVLIFEYLASPNTDRIAKVCAFNAAFITPPAAHTCPSAARSVSYAYSGTRVSRFTDATGAGWTTSNNYSASLTPFQERFFKPGYSQPWLVNSYTRDMEFGASLSVGQQDFADGRRVEYTFQFIGRGDLPGGAILLGTGWTTNGQRPTSIWWKTYQHDVNDTPAVAGPDTVTDALGRQTKRTYDGAFSRIVTVTKPSGITTHYTQNGNRNITEMRQTAAPGHADAPLISSYTYDCASAINCKKPASVTDARGNTSHFTYDPVHGGALTETSPAPTAGAVRPRRRFGWAQYYAWYRNTQGAMVRAPTPLWLVTSISECRTQASCAGTADEIKTTFTYGPEGVANNLLLWQKTVAAGDGSLSSTVTYAYDENGDKTSEDGPLAGSADTTVWKYDALRRVVGTIGPDPDGAGALHNRATRNTYDAAGRVTKVELGTTQGQSDAQWAAFSPIESTETEYDILDRRTKVVRKGGATTYTVTQYSYDGFGALECTAVRMNPASFSNLPASACTPGTAGSQGPDRITRNFYDAAGQLVKVQRGVGTPDVTDYESKTYTVDGDLETLTDGQNNRTTFEYDGHGRLEKVRYPLPAAGQLASSTTDYEQLVHDGNGNVTSRRLRDGQVISYTLDALNRLTRKDLPAPETDLLQTYDLQGHPLSITQGSAISFSWDALGRLRGESTSLGTMAYDYDAAGRRIRTTWPDGFHVTQDFLVTGEVQAIRENGASSGVGVLATYSHDDRGNVTRIARGNGTTTVIVPDAISRVTSMSQDLGGAAGDLTSAFQYNAANQVVENSRSNGVYAWQRQANESVAYVLNGLNQFTSAGGVSMGYDARGNLTRLGAKTFAYSSENRLLSDSAGASLQYDPSGRLFQTSRSGQTTRFQYDGTDLVAEYDASNVLRRRYVHGPGDDQPLVWYEGSGTADRRWLHQDERDSVIAITDVAGATIATNTYDEYGEPAPTNVGRFSFTGQTWLPETQLLYFKARVYSPDLGRFLQTDPTGYKDGPNLYAYVDSDPINGSDPTGTSVWTKLFKLGKAVVKGGDMATEFADNLSDINTIFDDKSTFGQKTLAVLSLATEFLPVSTADLKDAGRVLGMVEKVEDKAKAASNVGRAGRQNRLKEIGSDAKASSADRGWIKNEKRHVEQGNRDTIRNPPGKDLAHERGREAAKGYSYEHSNLQDRQLHRIQHKLDNNGRNNIERPPE